MTLVGALLGFLAWVGLSLLFRWEFGGDRGIAYAFAALVVGAALGYASDKFRHRT